MSSSNACPDALIGIGLTAAMRQRLNARPAGDGETPMRVVEVRRDAACLHDGTREVVAMVPPMLAMALAVGDWVLAEQRAPGRWRIVERVPPLTQIARRTNDGRGAARRQVLVANVDTAFLVMGLDRDFNLRRLERYLALAHLAAVPAVLLLTKAVDTPGLRALRLDVDAAADLNAVFDDVGALALRCRFRNCRHQSEPGCAVRDGLSAERVRSFHKLQREAKRDSMNALEMREQRRDWKRRGREGAIRARAKRGDQ